MRLQMLGRLGLAGRGHRSRVRAAQTQEVQVWLEAMGLQQQVGVLAGGQRKGGRRRQRPRHEFSIICDGCRAGAWRANAARFAEKRRMRSLAVKGGVCQERTASCAGLVLTLAQLPQLKRQLIHSLNTMLDGTPLVDNRTKNWMLNVHCTHACSKFVLAAMHL